jgi:NADPH:quinone reductase-like Zn-dependent oxidoreductase
MKAIANDRYGPPDEVLEVVDVAPPEAGPGEVVVRVDATSVNPADWHLIRGEPAIARLSIGLRRPKHEILGCDVAGSVEHVGPGVTTPCVGDEVYGSPFMRGFGAFAEHVRVPVDHLAPKPPNLSFEHAAAVPLAASTALQGLRDHGRLEPGQNVLIVGASGGVGTFAVQIAAALGAEVTGVCSTANADLVRSLGAHHVVDYTREDFTASGRRYDLALQVAGSHSPSSYRRVLTPTGTLVQISGDSTRRLIGPVGRVIAARLLSAFSRRTMTSFTVKPNTADLEHLTELIQAGKVTPVIDRTYPLRELPDAIRYLETGRARGKVVITAGI